VAETLLRRGVLASLVAAAALVLSGCGATDAAPDVAATGLVTGDNHGYRGAYLDVPYVVPDVTLTDTGGAPYSLATDPAPLKLVFFGYTNCPDVCQVVMSTLASAVSRLDAAERAEVEVVFVTTDPARDTGRVLRTYLDRLDPDFVGVTGGLPKIVELARPLKVFIDKGQKLPSGGYDVTHTTEVFGVTGDQARLVWGQDASPAELAADIIKLLKS
jgi:protein SCO1/2